MKQITKNTILRQNDKTYQPVEVDGVICWIDKSTLADEIVVQSQPKLEGVPVISLLDYQEVMENIIITESLTSDDIISLRIPQLFKLTKENQYTQKDIDKAIELAQESGEHGYGHVYNKEQILEQINSISILEVDSEFQILSYK